MSFLEEVINNRLKNSESIDSTYNNISAILGQSHYKSYNELANEIRTPEVRTYYYGWKTVSDLCSGDIAHILRLVRDIFSNIENYERFSIKDAIVIPLSRETQDRAIRELGNDFLTRIEAAPITGKTLRKITEAFGDIANWYLIKKQSKNQSQNPPWQAFRIEIREALSFKDSEKDLLQIYNDLLRYGIFIRDVRGKSQRGAVVPRLYLRRLLLPTFRLTPNKRDNIGLNVEEFLLLLEEPSKFVIHMKGKSRDDTGLQSKWQIG